MYKGSERWVARLRTLQLPKEQKTLKLKSDKSYVITGDLGGLGLALCDHLLNLGAGRVHLLSRREASKKNSQIYTHQVDVCNEQELIFCLDAIEASSHPIAGIFYLAGMDDRAAFIEYDWLRFEKVLAAKIYGAQNLHRYTQKISLDYFVLFSSIASAIGSARQAPYVLGNAYLDTCFYAFYQTPSSLGAANSGASRSKD